MPGPVLVDDLEPSEAAAPKGAEDRVRRVPWRRALLVGLIAFSVWVVLDAPTLLHSAEASPLGARRSVAVAVLRPLSALSRDLGLSHVVGAADKVLGRDGPGVLQAGRVPAPPLRGPTAPGVLALHPGRPASVALPALPAPTAADPLRVLSVGDSLGVDFGGPFADDLSATGVVDPVVDAHVDTGLSRPDYFDWPAELQADLTQFRPEAVVVFLGANDPQNLVDAGDAVDYGTPRWDDVYAARVGQFMSEATSAGARVLWVGMPPMADSGLNGEMQVVNGIFQQQAAVHPGVSYLSSWTVLGTPQGAFTEYLSDASGAPVAVREPDGTHVSPAGADVLSHSVIAAMDHLWGLSLAS
jgi:uncharacterized protein